MTEGGPGRASEVPLASLRAPKLRLRMTGSAGGRGVPAWTHRADPGTALLLVGLAGRCGPGTPRARQAIAWRQMVMPH